MTKQTKTATLIALLALTAGIGIAQRTAREAEQGSIPTPEWKNDPHFKKDVFTFARVKYSTGGRYGRWGGWGRGRWATDYPDSDLNLSFRLQQMTSLKVDPDARVIELSDKELFDFPFIYIVEPGGLVFTEDEVTVLRQYLLNGGFLMVDDFWGEAEWANFEHEIKRVFYDRPIVDLELDHHVFHSVFDLKEKPQMASIHNFYRYRGTEYEHYERSDARDVHYRGIYDDKGRLMVIACHNTDLGDGWEREGENEEYFHKYSERMAYPMGINILFYAMTH